MKGEGGEIRTMSYTCRLCGELVSLANGGLVHSCKAVLGDSLPTQGSCSKCGGSLFYIGPRDSWAGTGTNFRIVERLACTICKTYFDCEPA